MPLVTNGTMVKARRKRNVKMSTAAWASHFTWFNPKVFRVLHFHSEFRPCTLSSFNGIFSDENKKVKKIAAPVANCNIVQQ